jgi:hypothetical protein
MGTKLQLTLDFEEGPEAHLDNVYPGWTDYRIISQALDARGANRGKRPKDLVTVEVIRPGEEFDIHKESFAPIGPIADRPIIVGAGPAGLFCALRLAEYGIASIIIERGDRAHRRMIHIARHWRYGEFDRENNVCYGEGGAGLFSDGKLITRVKSPHISYVMNRFVDFGAPPETAYLANPHLGSNKIRQLIGKMSAFLESKGCDLHYNARVDDLLVKDKEVIGVRLNDGREIHSSRVILAAGHSANDIYEMAKKLGVAMRPKSFAVGVRIEHPRAIIDKIQYGDFAGDPKLGAARYRLSWENPSTQKGTYSFCMCPGGYVLSSGTEGDGIVVNGMSNYARNSRWSNAALVVSVEAGKDFKTDDVLGGMHFQREIEASAYQMSCELGTGKELPAQGLKDFLAGKYAGARPLKSSSPSGAIDSDLTKILPDFISSHLKKALLHFDQMMKGFNAKEALLLAPETRTSAPVTMLRDRESLVSESHKGLYPCGEGAGHAGGITSAAVDGVKVAESIVRELTR